MFAARRYENGSVFVRAAGRQTHVRARACLSPEPMSLLYIRVGTPAPHGLERTCGECVSLTRKGGVFR